MPAWLYSGVRAVSQAVLGFLLTYLASRGINLPVEAQNWILQTVLIGGGIAAWTAAVRWLEDRKGDGFWPRAGRWLAKVVHFGASKAPVYVKPDDTIRVNGVLRR